MLLEMTTARWIWWALGHGSDLRSIGRDRRFTSRGVAAGLLMAN